MLFRIVESIKIVAGKVVRFPFRHKKRPSKVKPADIAAVTANCVLTNDDVDVTDYISDKLPPVIFLQNEKYFYYAAIDKHKFRIRSRQFTTIIRTPTDTPNPSSKFLHP